MKLASETTQPSVAGCVQPHFYYIYKGGDYNGQENCNDKNNESRKDSKDK